MKRIKCSFHKYFILPILAIITLLLSLIFSVNAAFVERFYSQGIYPEIATVLSFISRWFPFSLDDVFYILLVTTFILLIVLLIFGKIKFKRFAIILINIISVAYIAFYWFWGFNYYRENLNQRLEMATVKPDKEMFLQVFNEIVEQTNKDYFQVDKINKDSINAAIENSYKQHAGFLKIDYPCGFRRPKAITFSHFFGKAGIQGYYGPFFSETHVNTYNLPIQYPYVLAHEKAHQMSVTSEAEANFCAWLVCSESKNRTLRYSADLSVLSYFVNVANEIPEARAVINNLSDSVVNDFNNIQNYWLQLKNKTISATAKQVNNSYLKANNVKRGIKDYYGVLQFIMDYKMQKN